MSLSIKHLKKPWNFCWACQTALNLLATALGYRQTRWRYFPGTATSAELQTIAQLQHLLYPVFSAMPWLQLHKSQQTLMKACFVLDSAIIIINIWCQIINNSFSFYLILFNFTWLSSKVSTSSSLALGSWIPVLSCNPYSNSIMAHVASNSLLNNIYYVFVYH